MSHPHHRHRGRAPRGLPPQGGPVWADFARRAERAGRRAASSHDPSARATLSLCPEPRPAEMTGGAPAESDRSRAIGAVLRAVRLLGRNLVSVGKTQFRPTMRIAPSGRAWPVASKGDEAPRGLVPSDPDAAARRCAVARPLGQTSRSAPGGDRVAGRSPAGEAGEIGPWGRSGARPPMRPVAASRPAVSCLVLLALACGCAPGANLPPLPDYKAESYRLGAGDHVRVIVYGEDQLTGEFRVDDQGRIALPLLGGVRAAGLNPQQLDAAISDELRRRNLLRDPSVSVEVLAYRPVFILGEVAKPGQYPFQPGMTVLTAVAVAGGYTYRAVQDYASVLRTTGGQAVEGRVSPRAFVAPGDVVTVFERRF